MFSQLILGRRSLSQTAISATDGRCGSVQGFTSSTESKCAFTARLWPPSRSPVATAAFDCAMNSRIWFTISRWLELSWSSATFFRFYSVAALSWSVEDLSEACSAAVLPVSWTLGSLDPPLRMTFLGGGQGFNAAAFPFFASVSAESVVVDPAVADPAVPGPAVVNPGPVEFAGSAGLPTVVSNAVGVFEQLGGIVFLRRGRAGVGLA